MSDEKDIIKQLVNDPQVQPESEIDIWESIFNDKWYTTDIVEEKIARLHQDFEIKRREHIYDNEEYNVGDTDNDMNSVIKTSLFVLGCIVAIIYLLVYLIL